MVLELVRVPCLIIAIVVTLLFMVLMVTCRTIGLPLADDAKLTNSQPAAASQRSIGQVAVFRLASALFLNRVEQVGNVPDLPVSVRSDRYQIDSPASMILAVLL